MRSILPAAAAATFVVIALCTPAQAAPAVMPQPFGTADVVLAQYYDNHYYPRYHKRRYYQPAPYYSQAYRPQYYYQQPRRHYQQYYYNDQDY